MLVACAGARLEPAPPISPTAIGRAALARLAFMEGTWHGEIEGARSEEIWSAPRGGGLVGVGRITDGDRTLFFEFLRVEARGDEIVLVAQPRGGDPVEFRLVEQHDGDALFTNPAHDFPKRIRYTRDGANGLRARAEGDAPEDTEELHWRRAEPPGHGD